MTTKEQIERSLSAAWESLFDAGTGATTAATVSLLLLLLKRLADQPDAVGTAGGDGQADRPTWSHTLLHGHEMASALVKELQAIAAAYPAIRPVVEQVDFARLVDRIDNRALSQAALAVYDLDLRDSSLSEAGIVGLAAEWVLDNLARTPQGGEHTEPGGVSALLAQLAQLREGMDVCDSAFGNGRTLAACGRTTAPDGRDWSVHLRGQEINPEAAFMAALLLLLNGCGSFDLRLGDTIRDPRFVSGDRLDAFDRIVCHPPFGNLRGYEFKDSNDFGRFRLVVPRKGSLDTAMILHALAALKPDGRAVLLLPNGFLFRGGPDEELRQVLLKLDLVEAVISLPARLLPATQIQTAVLVINKAKAADRQKKVLFVDASELCDTVRRRNVLRDQHVERIVQAYQAFTPEPGFAAVVDVEQLNQEDHSLLVSKYVVQEQEQQAINVADELDRLRQAQSERARIEDRFLQTLKQLGVAL